MAAGISLTDDNRRGWLNRIADRLGDAKRAGIVSSSRARRSSGSIVTCCRSVGSVDLRFVYLAGAQSCSRSAWRTAVSIFMPPSLLDSQLAILEEPSPDEHAWVCDIRDTPDIIVADLVGHAA